MNIFSTTKPSMLDDTDINAYWFFKNIDVGTKFPMVDELLRLPKLVELLERSRWITHPRIEPDAVLATLRYVNDIIDRQETDERVREALYSLRVYYEEDHLFFIPKLNTLNKEIRLRIINNDYIVDESIKEFVSEVLGQKIKGDIAKMNQRFDELLRPTFDKILVDETFEFWEHQKYTLLWVFDNIINNSHQLVDLDLEELLIYHKTRSGKSIMMAAIIALFYVLDDEKPYFNVFLTGFRPDVFHSPVEALDIFNFEKNIIYLKDIDIDEIRFKEEGVNMVVSSFQYLYGKNDGQDKPKFLRVQEENYDLLVIDEAHDASQAARTKEETSKILRKMELCMTATPNKERLLKMQQSVFDYREEQTLKLLGFNAYKNAPTRKTWDLSVYDDVLPLIRKKGYADVDDFIFNYGNVESEECHHDSELIRRVIAAIVYGIYNTAFSEGSLKIKFKQWKITGRKLLKTVNDNTVKSSRVSEWIDVLQMLSSKDLKGCWDTVIVMENVGALKTLHKILESDKNISKLFDIYSEHSYMPNSERMLTKGLENLTSQRGTNPRIIILCGVGLQGSTFKSVQNVIHLHEINSDARYKQAVERPSTGVAGKDEYNILDFDPLKLLGFDPTMTRVGPGGDATETRHSALFSDGKTPLTDEELVRRLAENYDDVYDLQKFKTQETEQNALIDLYEDVPFDDLLDMLPISNEHDMRFTNKS